MALCLRTRLVALVAVCLALLGAALLVRSPWTASAAPAGPPPAAREQTLAEALAQPHGHAAGDQVLRRSNRPQVKVDGSVGVGRDAAGVNAGRKRQAAGVPLRTGRPAVSIDEVATDVSRAGGCALGYGRGVACLPALPPEHAHHAPGTPRVWTCAQVRELLPEGIAVNRPQDGTAPAGVDPLRLDSDGDLVACDAGDA